MANRSNRVKTSRSTAGMEEIHMATCIPRPQIREWFAVFVQVLHDRLASGRETHLKKVGVFHIRSRKGRTMIRNQRVIVQKDSKYIRFKASVFVTSKLNNRPLPTTKKP
jgi:nucleoid DNA-binding protein